MLRKTLTLLMAAASTTSAVAAIRTGPAVGKVIPSFRARDQYGKWRTFEDLRGPKGLLLLFHRSADW